MQRYVESINRHYGGIDISARILAALREAGKDVNTLTRDDLAAIDEFHSGGREATRRLAQLAGLSNGMHVLDVGSGVGGPARTLAAEFGCKVTGLDLTEEFCRAATMLTERLGLGDRVTFRYGNALNMPFDTGTFDVVWTQNTLMNIEDKRRLFKEVYRVLRPGGCFALQSIMAGPVPNLHFPAMWASDPSLSFLLPPEEFRRMLLESGFRELKWEDETGRFLQLRQASDATVPGRGPQQLNVGVFVLSDFTAKLANSRRNYEEGRTVAIQAVFQRAE